MWIAPAGYGQATSIAGWTSWMRVSSALRTSKMSMSFASTGSCTAEDGGLSAVATANGLVLFDAAAHEKQVLGKAEGLIANQVTDVLLRGDSRSPTITAATPAGITTIDASGTSSLYAFHGLVNNHVYALAAEGTRILAGTLGGLSILDSGYRQRKLHHREFRSQTQLDHGHCSTVATTGSSEPMAQAF